MAFKKQVDSKPKPERKIQFKFTDKHRMFVAEYVKDLDGPRAAAAVGFKNPASAACKLLNPEISPIVVSAIRDAIDKMETRCELTAEYVRDYIQTAMEFKPGKWFKAGEGGGWLISEEAYKLLPDKIARLIEEMELKEMTKELPDGSITTLKFLRVRFVSKTVAMTTAAKYTLTQRLELPQATLDIGAIMKRVQEKKQARQVEERIRLASMQPQPPLPIEDKKA